MEINRGFSPESIEVPPPMSLPLAPDGMSVKQLPKPPSTPTPSSVRNNPLGRPPPPVPIRTTAKLTSKQLEGERKAMKDKSSEAKGQAFGKEGSISGKMEALGKYHALQRDLAVNKGKLKEARKAIETPMKGVWRKLKTNVGKGIEGASRMSGEGRIREAFVSPKRLVSDLLDNRNCKKLIAEGQTRLQDTNIPHEERQAIENGIKLLNEHIEKKTSSGKHAAKAAVSAVSIAQKVANFAYAVTKMAALVSSTIQVVPILGQVVGTVTLPLGAALCFDAMVAIKNNLKQVGQDRDLIGKSSEKLNKAYQQDLRLDDVSGELERTSAPSPLKAQIRALAGEVNAAQTTIKNADDRLIAGNLKKPEIAALKKQRLEAQSKLQNSMSVAINLLSTHVEAHPDIKPVLHKAHAKQLIASSASSLEGIINPYLNQRLQTKGIGEWVKGAGEMMGLAGAGLGAVALVSTIATGGSAGLPLLLSAAVMSLGSVATIYGGGILVNKLRKMQLGDDRVKSDKFDAALLGQLEKEVKNWDVLKGSNMEGNTTAAAMFEVVKKHYSGMPEKWGAKEWAESLVNDAPNGPERKRFQEALNVMLYHDSSKGIIGGITNKAVGALEKKLDKKAAAKAAA